MTTASGLLHSETRTVLLTGATGFIGRALTRRLVERGDRVIALSRDPARARRVLGPAPAVVGSLGEIDVRDEIDAVVNLAGAPVLGRRWTKRRRQVLAASRIGATRGLVDWLAGRAQRPEVLASASAIAWYGEGGEAALDETSPVGGDFRAALCNAWEREAGSAAMLGIRVCRLRFGTVLGRDGKLLGGLLPFYRLGLGGKLGDGRQWLSWIHIDDAVELILRSLGDPLFRGPVNVTAPVPVRQAGFAAALGRVLGRPAMLRVPAFALKAGLGEMSHLLLDSQKVLPRRAREIGFVFRCHDVETALEDLLRPPHAARPGPTVRLLDDLLT
ncbi:MAG TPA: TIGR01777 family oxidoreductase [Dongiaceae bacterium]|nr:TIGR01777 family oxidoreductase [Dongiaceae bacterium]